MKEMEAEMQVCFIKL